MGLKGTALKKIPKGAELLKNPMAYDHTFPHDPWIYNSVAYLANSKKKGDYVHVTKGLHFGDSRQILHFNIMLYDNYKPITPTPLHVDVDVIPENTGQQLYKVLTNGDISIPKTCLAKPKLILLRISNY